MSMGLRVWDNQGRILLDIPDRITRLLGTYAGYFYYVHGFNELTIPITGFLNNNETMLFVNTNYAVDIVSLTSESIKLTYYSYYQTGSIYYEISVMGF